MVSEWRSVIAVSLNVGGGVRLIKTGKSVHVHAEHYKHNGAGCVRQWFRTAESLGERLFRESEHTHTFCSSNTRNHLRFCNLLKAVTLQCSTSNTLLLKSCHQVVQVNI